MDINSTVRELGQIRSAPALASAVFQLPEDVWSENKIRQENYKVHRQTQSLVLIFCEGEWPEVDIQLRESWNHLSKYAVPVMREILDAYYVHGGAILRAMVAKLFPHGTIDSHIDRHPSFASAHRIHVPLVTNPDVIFQVDGKQITMNAGYGYEINNQKVHAVHNGGEISRLHFIFDYAPPDEIVRMPVDTQSTKCA